MLDELPLERRQIPHVVHPLVEPSGELRRDRRQRHTLVGEEGEDDEQVRRRLRRVGLVHAHLDDDVGAPRTPPQLLVILALLADEQVPLQTIAPKFTGRFNKGVDYVGDLAAFEREFSHDVAVLAYAAERYGLPRNLKLSVHSGSDKIDIDRARLPSPAELETWDGPRLAAAIRHVPSRPEFNPHVRQLLHVSFKVAAKHGSRYTDLLDANRDVVARQVTENILERHLRPLFGAAVPA
ncbi:MAG: hypothetical protein EBR23_01565 [Planctomycetia bacterium]|nr:hypothetical protein [Planctomycetia bacterium]